MGRGKDRSRSGWDGSQCPVEGQSWEDQRVSPGAGVHWFFATLSKTCRDLGLYCHPPPVLSAMIQRSLIEGLGEIQAAGGHVQSAVGVSSYLKLHLPGGPPGGNEVIVPHNSDCGWEIPGGPEGRVHPLGPSSLCCTEASGQESDSCGHTHGRPLPT